MSIEIEDLRKQIREAEFCVAVEITSNISGEIARERKRRQAITRQRYLGDLSQREVYTALMFYYAGNFDNMPDVREGINFLLQVPPFDKESLERTLGAGRDRLTHKRQYTVERLIASLDAGENLDDLLQNRDTWDWRTFLQRYPYIAGSSPSNNGCHDYGVIGVTGGTFLEEYARLLCMDELPGVTVHGAQHHEGLVPGKNGKEIDMIVIGPKEVIVEGLNSPQYFTRHHE